MSRIREWASKQDKQWTRFSKVDNVLDRGKSKGGGCTVNDSVKRLIELLAAVRKDIHSEQFHCLFNRADYQEKHQRMRPSLDPKRIDEGFLQQQID